MLDFSISTSWYIVAKNPVLTVKSSIHWQYILHTPQGVLRSMEVILHPRHCLHGSRPSYGVCKRLGFARVNILMLHPFTSSVIARQLVSQGQATRFVTLSLTTPVLPTRHMTAMDLGTRLVGCDVSVENTGH